MTDVQTPHLGQAAAHAPSNNGDGNGPNRPNRFLDASKEHEANLSTSVLELLEREGEATLEQLQKIFGDICRIGKVPKYINKKVVELFKEATFRPTAEISYRPSAKKRSFVIKSYPNRLISLLGEAAQGRTIQTPNDECDMCKSRNGHFNNCTTLQREDGSKLMDGACMNCLFSGSSTNCTLSGKYKAPTPRAAAPKKAVETIKTPVETVNDPPYCIKIPISSAGDWTEKGAFALLKDVASFQDEFAKLVGKGDWSTLANHDVFKRRSYWDDTRENNRRSNDDDDVEQSKGANKKRKGAPGGSNKGTKRSKKD